MDNLDRNKDNANDVLFDINACPDMVLVTNDMQNIITTNDNFNLIT